MTTEEKKTKFMITDKEMTERLEAIEKTGDLVVGGVTDIEDEVIAQIVGVAAREVEGIASLGTSSIRRTLAEAVGAACRHGCKMRVRRGDVQQAILVRSPRDDRTVVLEAETVFPATGNRHELHLR